jgi:tRNA/tmRNA/rRNA uracil-C5-methylase (TrmA/RlmC/RlmD family)
MDIPSGVQRAVSALRAALPFVQRILPLLDGNIGSAVSNLLAPHHHTAPPSPTVNLAPITESLVELQTQQRELRNQVVEQNSSLKRVEDQLEMVREATDRNTLEQQELLEDLKSVGNKVNLFAFIALGLLGVSVILNIVLYLHILRVLP